jgi:hypothetical protein
MVGVDVEEPLQVAKVNVITQFPKRSRHSNPHKLIQTRPSPDDCAQSREA